MRRVRACVSPTRLVRDRVGARVRVGARIRVRVWVWVWVGVRARARVRVRVRVRARASVLVRAIGAMPVLDTQSLKRRPAGCPEAALSARSWLRLPHASASLGPDGPGMR